MSRGRTTCSLKITAVGVCGSECHFYARGMIGHYVVEDAVILGRGCSATVVAVPRPLRSTGRVIQ